MKIKFYGVDFEDDKNKFVDICCSFANKTSESDLIPESELLTSYFTFPANNPIKRIDFILVKNGTASLNRIISATTRIVGKDATAKSSKTYE